MWIKIGDLQRENTSAEVGDLNKALQDLIWGHSYMHSLFPLPALNLQLWAWVETQHGKEENAESNSDSLLTTCVSVYISQPSRAPFCHVNKKENEYIEITDVWL